MSCGQDGREKAVQEGRKGALQETGNVFKRRREKAMCGTGQSARTGQKRQKGSAGRAGKEPENILRISGGYPEKSRRVFGEYSGNIREKEIRAKKEHQDRVLCLRTDALKCAVRDSNPGHPD